MTIEAKQDTTNELMSEQNDLIKEQNHLLKDIIKSITECGYTPPKADKAKPAKETKEPEAKSKTPDQPKKPTKEDVISVLTDLRDSKGTQAAKDALAHFDVKKVPDLKPEQYQDVINYVKEVA